jgi:glycosyltransferase involved in cell wall biosynthesis
MHVAFVLPRSYPYRGGYENSILSLAKYLVAHGHRATVFTTTADDLEAFWLPGFKTFPQEQCSIDGVVVRRFPISHNVIQRRASRVLGLAPYWRWKAKYWRPSFHVIGLAEALRSVDADLFHVGPLPYNSVIYAGLYAGESRNIPVVATPCSHLGEPGRNAVVQHYLQRHQLELLRHCSRVFCMTETERGHRLKCGIANEKLRVIPFGIDFANVIGGDSGFLRKKYNVDGPVVLHLGMKAFEKGSETVVEAMKLLWARGSNAWLVMAGPSLSTFDTFLAAAGKDCSRLLNLPAFADRERRDFLASATVVAQPSRVESLGLVLFEAWANRTPVIAADIEVSRELINTSGGGVTVPFGNAERLADALEKMLSDPTGQESMGAGGLEKSMQYHGSAVWERFVAEFEGVVRRS